MSKKKTDITIVMPKKKTDITIVTIRANNDVDCSNSVSYKKIKVKGKDPLNFAYKIALLFDCVQSESYADTSTFVSALIENCSEDIEKDCGDFLKFNKYGEYSFKKKHNGHFECARVALS